MAVLREILTRFGFDVDEKGFSKFQANIVTLNQGIELVGKTLGVASRAVQGLFTEQFKLADELDATATSLGIGTDALQGLQFAADQSGSSAQSLNDGLRFLSKNIIEAAQGSKEMQAAFARLGIDVVQAQMQPLEKTLGQAANGLSRMGNASLRANTAMQVFGRGGTALLPLLIQGEQGIGQLTKRFQDLGGGFSPQEVAALKDAGDAFKELNVIWTRIRITIASALTPALRGVVASIADFFVKNRELINQRLEKFFAAAGEFVINLVRGLFTLAKSAKENQVTFLALGAALLFMIAPAIAVGLAIIALAEDFAGWQRGADSAIGRVLAALRKFAEDAPEPIRQAVEALVGTFELLKKRGMKAVVDAWIAALELGLLQMEARILKFVAEDIPKIFGLGEQTGFLSPEFRPGGKREIIQPGFTAEGVKNLVDAFFKVGDLFEDFSFLVQRTKTAALQPIVGREATRGIVAGGSFVPGPVSINAPITINAAPGMDEKTIKSLMSEQFGMSLADTLRQTAAATTGAR
jgi:hypothetical protein